MDSLVLSSDDFQLGPYLLPGFQLRMGECVCLHLPEGMARSEVNQLIRVLIGQCPDAGIHLYGRVSWAAPLRTQRRGLSGLFHSMRVGEWLVRVAGASPVQAQTILHKLPPNQRDGRMEQLPGTPRTLLSVEAAWLGGADAVVFTTEGLDPLGREAVFQAVHSHFDHGSAIHLSFPFVQNGVFQRHCFPGTLCLELRRSAEQSGSTTTHLRTK